MGYELHITRTADWTECESAPITLEEWIDLVNADPEMRLDGVAEANTPSGVLRYANEGLAVWVAYSKHGVGGGMVWFDHVRGRITVKSPDNEIRGKMKQIARKLAAQVIGDEGEEY